MRDALEQYAARARRFGTRDTHETEEKPSSRRCLFVPPTYETAAL